MHVKFRQLQRCFGLYFEKVQVTFDSVVKYGHLHLIKFANIQIVLLFVSWSYFNHHFVSCTNASSEVECSNI